MGWGPKLFSETTISCLYGLFDHSWHIICSWLWSILGKVLNLRGGWVSGVRCSGLNPKKTGFSSDPFPLVHRFLRFLSRLRLVYLLRCPHLRFLLDLQHRLPWIYVCQISRWHQDSSCPQDDLCILIWISVMFCPSTQRTRETAMY